MVGKRKAILGIGGKLAQIGEAEPDMRVEVDQCWNASLEHSAWIFKGTSSGLEAHNPVPA